MTLRTGIFIFAAVALVCSACSEEKKREAARLEAKLRGDTLVTAENQIATDDSVTDTALVDSMNKLATEAFDSSYHAEDSTTASTQTAVVTPESSATAMSTPQSEPAKETRDTIIPDVNAVPAENGASSPRTMPRHIEDAYTVQIASSTDQAFSQRIVDTFLARGYDAYMGTVTHDGTTYYRVRVGRFARPADANLVAVEINQKYSLQSWVDKITK
ncbi:hypothetical protein C3F09_00475 [candidate division GN15 bacterium]|uniref:SPOR domain-containing protein n=1 Tax=candidate division GN15 bacterium TaxID=2072418 RepID=A0A855X793_9BACT|nr:MAG: hypothetical protein C3F09_00475 [candidate division GN15 bacterium]